MSQSLRRTQNDREPENKESNPVVVLGQLVLLGFTIACAALGYWWLTSDVSGEYMGQDNQLGQVTISITRKPTNVIGDITYGREMPAKIVQGEIRTNGEIGLKTNTALFRGKLVDGSLKGSIFLDSVEYPIVLERNPLATLHRQIQAHLP